MDERKRIQVGNKEVRPIKGGEIKVVCWNVLASNFADHPATAVEHKDRRKRRAKIILRLVPEMRRSAVICLQEVDLELRMCLELLCEQHDYKIIADNYGSARSGRMGVAIMYPPRSYEMQTCDISVIGETKPKPPKTEPSTLWRAASNVVSYFKYVGGFVYRASGLGSIIDAVRVLPRQPKFELWDNVRERKNTMITLGLMPRMMAPLFYVSTYHMPCLFRHRDFMNAHAALAAQRAIEISGSHPLIFAGDFNSTPVTSTYSLMCDGEIEFGHKDYPKREWPTDNWTPDLRRTFRSAYRRLGGEPQFTNYAYSHVGKDVKKWAGETFSGTIDYIFYDGLIPTRAGALPLLEDSAPGPNGDEPSDHLMLSASFSYEGVRT